MFKAKVVIFTNIEKKIKLGEKKRGSFNSQNV